MHGSCLPICMKVLLLLRSEIVGVGLHVHVDAFSGGSQPGVNEDWGIDTNTGVH